jgi:hypothetical protein
MLLASVTNIVSAEGEVVAKRGEDVTITALLLQNGTYGDPVPNELIEFFDQTHNVLIDSDTTNIDGIALINWTIPLSFPIGTIIINATFRGDELLFLSASTQWIYLNIVSSTQITIEHEISSFAPGDSFCFTASLLDDASSPISGSKLIALCGNNVLASSITNSSGVASFTVQCNNSWITLGENIIRIVHEEDLTNFYARAEESFTIEIQQIVTSIDVGNYPNTVLLGDTITIDVNLLGFEDNISSEIGVYLDDIIFDTLVTNDFGNATVYLNVDTRFTPGIHTFQIIYNGTERYTSSFIIFELHIMSPALLDFEISETPIVGTAAEMTISVHDYFGRPFESALITLSDNTSGLNTTIQVPYNHSSSHFLFPFFGPPGKHNLQVKVGNPFITNDTHYLSLLVWSKPLLVLQESNIFHYASPNQEIFFSIRLVDWNGNCSFRVLQIVINGLPVISETTDTDGIASLKVIAPYSEGIYNISIIYSGNNTLYEISAMYYYHLIVSRLIPIHLEVYNLEVLPPLQELILNLKVKCLNGSMLAGIQIKFIWLSTEIRSQSQQEGALTLHLPVPSEKGNYSLYYEVENGYGLAYSSGSIEITILQEDVLASQGIGIGGFAFSIMVSLVTIAIPVIRQRYLAR